MEGAALKEQPIQFTDEREASLHNRIQGLLGRLGYRHDTRPEAQRHILSAADVIHIAGSTIEELVRGGDPAVRDRVATTNPLQTLLERIRKRKPWR